MYCLQYLGLPAWLAKIPENCNASGSKRKFCFINWPYPSNGPSSAQEILEKPSSTPRRNTEFKNPG